MSENSQDKALKILARNKQQSQQIEQNLQESINKKLDDALIDFSNALNHTVSQWQHLNTELSNNLMDQAQTLLDEKIAQTNQSLSQSVHQLQQAQQMLVQTTEPLQQINQKVASLQTQVAATEQQTQIAIADYAKNLTLQAQNHMQQSEKAYQRFYHSLSNKQANLKVKAMMLGLVTFFLAMLPTAAMLGMAVYAKQLKDQQQQQLFQVQQTVQQQQQQLTQITAKIEQTPIEARALAMVTVLPNDQNPKQMLIIPNNQQQVKFGMNPKRQLVLQVAPVAHN